MYALECGEFEDVLSWSMNGSSFAIKDKAAFEEKVLPALFKPSKFESFIRKLCRWGFAKRRTADCGDFQSQSVWFYHPNFQKGNFVLCRHVECRLNPKLGSTSIASSRTSSSNVGNHANIGVVPRNNISSSLESAKSYQDTFASTNFNEQRFLPPLGQSSILPATQHILESLNMDTGMQGQQLSHFNATSARAPHQQDIAAPMNNLGDQNDALMQHRALLELWNNHNSTNTTPAFHDSSQYNLSETVPISTASPGHLQNDSSHPNLYEVNKLSKPQQQGDMNNMAYLARAANGTDSDNFSRVSSGDGSGQYNVPNSKTALWNTQWNPNVMKNDPARLTGINFQHLQQPLPSFPYTSPPDTAMGSDTSSNGMNGMGNVSSVPANHQYNSKQEFAQLVSEITNLTRMCELLRQNQQASSQMMENINSSQSAVLSQQNHLAAPDQSQHQKERFFQLG
jgi:hypothetical protein